MKRVLLVSETELQSLRNEILDPAHLRPMLQACADGSKSVDDTLADVRRQIVYLFDSWKAGE